MNSDHVHAIAMNIFIFYSPCISQMKHLHCFYTCPFLISRFICTASILTLPLYQDLFALPLYLSFTLPLYLSFPYIKIYLHCLYTCPLHCLYTCPLHCLYTCPFSVSFALPLYLSFLYFSVSLKAKTMFPSVSSHVSISSFTN